MHIQDLNKERKSKVTIGKLHKELGKLITKDKKLARKKVVINKRTFTHPLELDGCCMLDVKSIEIKEYNILNDDGGLGHGINDVEKFTSALVLSGEAVSKESEA